MVRKRNKKLSKDADKLEGFYYALVGCGGVFVPHVGLVSGLLGKEGLPVPGVLRDELNVRPHHVVHIKNIKIG